MAAKQMKLTRMYAALEASFGVDPDATGALYKFLKVLGDVAWQPTADIVERPGMVNDIVRLPHVIAQKGGSLSFKLELKGSGTPAAGVASIAAEADVILQALFGNVVRGTGSSITTGATTTSIPLTTAAGIQKYMMVLVDCGATHGYVPRFVTAIVANTLTLDRALPVAPANGATVHASTRYVRANSGHQSLAFAAERAGVLYTFLGCKIDSAKITGWAARGTAILEVTCSVSDWNMNAKASLPAEFTANINLAKAPVVKASCVAVGGTEEVVYSLDLDFGLAFQFQDSTCGLGTAQPDSANVGHVLTDSAPQGTIKAYYAASHLTDMMAGTEKSVAFATPGTGVAWGFYAAKAQLGQITHEDHNGMFGESLPFMVNDNGTDPEYAFCVA